MDAVESDAAEGVGAATALEGTCRLDGLAIVLACLALAAALAAAGILPERSLPWCAAIAVFATSALPLLVRWSPVPADPLKLAAFTLALSPLLSASLWAAGHLVFGGRNALVFCAAVCAGLHLWSLRTSVRRVPRSRAQVVIVGLALALAIGASLLLLRGNEPRLAQPLVLRSAVALAVDRTLPPLHPWLAGEPWPVAWAADGLAAFSARALGVAPTFAYGLFAVLALTLLPLLLYSFAATLWSDARRSAISVALALGAGFIAFRAPGIDHLALEPYLSPGPSPLALTLSMAALACAAHALRHGKRPWIGLCALFHGFALLLEFSSAWPAALASILSALSPSCDARARPRLLLAVVLAALPGLAQARWLEPVAVAVEPRSLGALAVNFLGLVLVAVLGFVFARRVIPPERRVVLVLCAGAALLALLAALFAGPWTDPRAAWSLALFCMAIPCAALLPPSARPIASRWWGGAVASFAFGLGGLWILGQRCESAWGAARRSDALLGETARALEPISAEASAVDLRAALACVRGEERLIEDRAVLLACPAPNPYRKTRDLPEHALAACAGLALYGDARSAAVEREVEFQPRLEELLKLFRDPGAFDPTLFARLEQKKVRAVLALVREEDRAINPALPGKLERLGFARWREFGGVWLFIGPREAARRYVGAP